MVKQRLHSVRLGRKLNRDQRVTCSEYVACVMLGSESLPSPSNYFSLPTDHQPAVELIWGQEIQKGLKYGKFRMLQDKFEWIGPSRIKVIHAG